MHDVVRCAQEAYEFAKLLGLIPERWAMGRLEITEAAGAGLLLQGENCPFFLGMPVSLSIAASELRVIALSGETV